VQEAIRGAMESQAPFELEHRVIRLDGSPGWTSSRAVPIRDDRGAIVEWFGTASDVTQPKAAEECPRLKR
jgi:PAS domain-containing protein